MKSHLKLSAVLCSLACMAPPLAFAAGNVKQIEVCNNFPSKPIFLTLGSNKTPPKGFTGVPEGERKWFKAEIAAGKCLPTTIPLEHWGGGRAYIFDAKPKEDGPAWTDYNSDGNFQLVEFTFLGPAGDPNHGTKGDGVGYNFSAVDSVSSAIPLAVAATFIDPEKAKVMGVKGSYEFTGNSGKPDQAGLDAEFKKLVDAGWPYYPKSSNNGHYKIPGGYNALSYNKQVGMWTYKAGVKPMTPETLVARWKIWVDPGSPGYIRCDQNVPQSPNPADPKYTQKFCEEFQKTATDVWNDFKANRDMNKPDFVKFPHLNTDVGLAQHITGYAIFNESNGTYSFADLDAKKTGRKWTHLAQGLPNPNGELNLEPKYLKYRYPGYDSPYNLDPYVTAIHKNFNLNVYAFSINDEVGYFQAADQDKLVIAVGGLKGLLNQKQFQPKPKSIYNVNMGPGWNSAEACGYGENFAGDSGTVTPLLFVDSDSCQVTFVKNGTPMVKTTFTVKLENNKLLTPENCTDNKNGQICRGMVLNTNTGIDVNGPPPT